MIILETGAESSWIWTSGPTAGSLVSDVCTGEVDPELQAIGVYSDSCIVPYASGDLNIDNFRRISSYYCADDVLLTSDSTCG